MGPVDVAPDTIRTNWEPTALGVNEKRLVQYVVYVCGGDQLMKA